MCRARVHTIGEEITKVLNVHSNPPDPAKISGKQIFSKFKQLSMDVDQLMLLSQKFAKTLHQEFLVY